MILVYISAMYLILCTFICYYQENKNIKPTITGCHYCAHALKQDSATYRYLVFNTLNYKAEFSSQCSRKNSQQITITYAGIVCTKHIYYSTTYQPP